MCGEPSFLSQSQACCSATPTCFEWPEASPQDLGWLLCSLGSVCGSCGRAKKAAALSSLPFVR